MAFQALSEMKIKLKTEIDFEPESTKPKKSKIPIDFEPVGQAQSLEFSGKKSKWLQAGEHKAEKIKVA